MNRKIIVICIAALCMLQLFACKNEEVNNPPEEINIDIQKVTDEIFGVNPFGEELVSRDLSDYRDLYGFSCVPEKMVAYVGGGATAEELVIAEAKTEEDADLIKNSLEKYCQRQISSYSDYNAAEVPKLNQAIIKKNGVYVIYCVSSDDVTRIVSSYFA